MSHEEYHAFGDFGDLTSLSPPKNMSAKTTNDSANKVVYFTVLYMTDPTVVPEPGGDHPAGILLYDLQRLYTQRLE